MKKKYQYLFWFVLILFFYLCIFLSPNKALSACQNAISIFFGKLFPSIFPFFLLSFLLLHMNYTKFFERFLENIMRHLFHIEGSSSFVLIMSIISGFPSGAKYIASLYEKESLTKEESNYLLLFTHFANPLFLLGTCGVLLKSRSLAYKIFFIQLISNLLLGIFLRKKDLPPKRKRSTQKSTLTEENTSFFETLPLAINKTMEVLLFMLGSIATFQFFNQLLITYLPLNPFFEVLFTGFLDLTSGILVVPTLPLSIDLQAMIMLSFTTFGSLSVHIQVMNALIKTDLSYSYFFLGRVIQTAIAIILFLLF